MGESDREVMRMSAGNWPAASRDAISPARNFLSIARTNLDFVYLITRLLDSHSQDYRRSHERSFTYRRPLGKLKILFSLSLSTVIKKKGRSIATKSYRM